MVVIVVVDQDAREPVTRSAGRAVVEHIHCPQDWQSLVHNYHLVDSSRLVAQQVLHLRS
jgi:hypothetical protein